MHHFKSMRHVKKQKLIKSSKEILKNQIKSLFCHIFYLLLEIYF
jgi:hypothetical protein